MKHSSEEIDEAAKEFYAKLDAENARYLSSHGDVNQPFACEKNAIPSYYIAKKLKMSNKTIAFFKSYMPKEI